MRCSLREDTDMAEKQYTYAVARIRTKELSLLKSAFLEQLLAAKSYAECIQLLSEKGWGDGTATDAEQILKGEQEKTWALMEELVDDVSVFDVFLYANDYHNLKAAIKMVYLDTERREAFFSHGTVQPETMLKALREQDYSLLPEAMRAPAKEAFDLLLHTRDGQLCDVIVDRAALDAIYAAGKAADHPIIREYAELTVAAADIKIAVRAQKPESPWIFSSARWPLAIPSMLSSLRKLPSRGKMRSTAICKGRPMRMRCRCCKNRLLRLSAGVTT